MVECFPACRTLGIWSPATDTHTARHLWSNSQWHPPIQLNTQDLIPSDTCTPSQDVRDSIPTDTYTNTPSFCILNTWNNTNHDSRENVAAYICYFFSIFLGALSPRTMPPNLWGEIIPTLDLSSKHTIVSAQREQDIHRHPRSPIWPPTPSREELEDALLCQHVQWEKGREVSGHQAREGQTAETEWLQETATAAKTCHTCLPCGETLRNLTSVVVVLKVNSENKENQKVINKLYKKNIGLYSYVLLLLLFYCINWELYSNVF